MWLHRAPSLPLVPRACVCVCVGVCSPRTLVSSCVFAACVCVLHVCGRSMVARARWERGRAHESCRGGVWWRDRCDPEGLRGAQRSGVMWACASRGGDLGSLSSSVCDIRIRRIEQSVIAIHRIPDRIIDTVAHLGRLSSGARRASNLNHTLSIYVGDSPCPTPIGMKERGMRIHRRSRWAPSAAL